MTSHGPNQAAIKALLDEYLDAIRSKNLDRLMACYADDVIAYDMMPPLEYRGAYAYRAAWAQGLSASGGFVLELPELHIQADAEVAFAHALAHFDVTSDGKRMQGWFRWTAGFCRRGGAWKIVHEQTSVPTDMETNRALTDLKP